MGDNETEDNKMNLLSLLSGSATNEQAMLFMLLGGGLLIIIAVVIVAVIKIFVHFFYLLLLISVLIISQGFQFINGFLKKIANFFIRNFLRANEPFFR